MKNIQGTSLKYLHLKGIVVRLNFSPKISEVFSLKGGKAEAFLSSLSMFWEVGVRRRTGTYSQEEACLKLIKQKIGLKRLWFI